MRIVFFGTPEFAVPSLEILVRNGYEVAAVVTAPGKPAGRGLEIRQPPVRIAAEKLSLSILQPEKLSDPVFLRQLQEIGADLFIVVAFRMLPESVWKMPPLGTFNLHSSLLPQYRGAAPINRAIMNGEHVTGVTTFFLKHEIDTGNILFKVETIIGDEETAGELHDRLMIIGADLVLKTVRAIEKNEVHPTPQDDLEFGKTLHHAPKIFQDDCKINWSKTRAEVHNMIRGLSPFPGAFTHLRSSDGQQIKLKIYRSTIPLIQKETSPGQLLLMDKRLFIGCGDGLIEILDLQQEGKKRLPASEFIKGFRADKGWEATWQ
jgi:methionyl-tRNA formyltransferase